MVAGVGWECIWTLSYMVSRSAPKFFSVKELPLIGLLGRCPLGTSSVVEVTSIDQQP